MSDVDNGEPTGADTSAAPDQVTPDPAPPVEAPAPDAPDAPPTESTAPDVATEGDQEVEENVSDPTGPSEEE